MVKHRVLLLGATGETGGDILDGLVEDDSFDISLLVRPSSAIKPPVKNLEARGFPTVLSDLSEPVDELAAKINGFDIIISAITWTGLMSQIPLIEAAAKAGTKRFIPCAFGTVCPPGGVMHLRDVKEVVLNAILVAKVPYTVIDIGFWHQLSFPTVPSGKMDYASTFPNTNIIYADGTAENILTDKRDIGRFVARIIKDERTLNQKVVTVGDVLTQNQIWDIVERVGDEKMPKTNISTEEVVSQLEAAKAKAAASGKTGFDSAVAILSYSYSKFVREDNCPANAKYLGYLDTRELYPDFKPINFEQFVREVLQGEAKKPYANGQLDRIVKGEEP